jgi:hypothetical protein
MPMTAFAFRIPYLYDNKVREYWGPPPVFVLMEGEFYLRLQNSSYGLPEGSITRARLERAYLRMAEAEDGVIDFTQPGVLLADGEPFWSDPSPEEAKEAAVNEQRKTQGFMVSPPK